MLGKVEVVGENKDDLYVELSAAMPDATIEWNFAKYLLDGQGNAIKFYHHEVDPGTLMADIEQLLS